MGEYKLKSYKNRKRLIRTAIILYILFFALNKNCVCRKILKREKKKSNKLFLFSKLMVIRIRRIGHVYRKTGLGYD